MVITTLLALLIVGGLTAGWIAFFKEREFRLRLAHLGAKYEKRTNPAVLSSTSGIGVNDPTPTGASDKPAEAGNHTDDPFPRRSFGIDTENTQPKSAAVSITNMEKLDSLPATAGQIVMLDGEIPPEQKAAATTLVQNYWQAASWKEKSAMVRDRARTEPLMQRFYDEQKLIDPPAGALQSAMHFKFNGVEVMTLSYASSRVDGRVEVALLKESNQWRIDWESYVGYSDMAWNQFKKERPSQPLLFRTFATKGDYWNFEFSDETMFLSVHMLSPDGLTSIHGFCENDSSIGREVLSVLQKGQGRQPLVFRLAFPERAESDHCVRIVGLVSERWLLPP